MLFCALGCTKKEETVIVAFAPMTITPILLGKGDGPTLNNPNSQNLQNLILNNITDWNNFKSQFGPQSSLIYNLSETTIDFNLWQVIAVFDKFQGSSPNRIDIISIIENQNNLTITIQKFFKGDATFPSQAHHIIKIPQSTKPIIFQVNEPI